VDTNGSYCCAAVDTNGSYCCATMTPVLQVVYPCRKKGDRHERAQKVFFTHARA
jgi:hypothetical protein